ncbi:uncharacterized protein TEOVI_000377300 [Trypanosoma equiperdum]|uniref:Uncharacterized protein n=2 Tax=Trypanozoon TaxID=39700 RepID=Q38F88_TRYB2|nr:hypothetical protein, conserved [Trypanosoma brucei brucei TREU927]EAN76532.1 hypothetical protein, conserved [Trypanosoma brucei brucei TREU927]SCU72197.1 hypothetical protein, conserved [Trypanosoma equiperdum]
MFVMKLLDALADAAVLLMFNVSPTNSGSDNDEEEETVEHHFVEPNNISHMERHTAYATGPLDIDGGSSDSNCVLTAPSMTVTTSADGSSFVQLTEEDMQLMPEEQSISGGSYDETRTPESVNVVNS